MVFDLNILNDYVEKGLVVKNDHPTLPLSIYNYSRTTQYEGKWDHITKSCRGLILDRDGNVIAKSFDKFFNMEEHSPEEIPNEEFEVYEKLDGSLGILFWYQGKWILASKGSFTSDQVIKGKNILNSKYNVEPIPKGYTTLVEIIYPENRIVCNYGDDEVLVVLSMVSNANGKELDYDSLLKINEETGLPVVKKYDGVQDYKTLKDLISADREGYVIRFRNGFRMKIKGEEYVRFHRILTGFSNIDIWEYLKDGKNFEEFLDKVPDEFDSWVKGVVDDLNKKFEVKKSSSAGFVDEYRRRKHLAHEPLDKKEFAILVMNQPRDLRPIMFAMYDGKTYDKIIWSQIRPNWSKPFWKKEEDL